MSVIIDEVISEIVRPATPSKPRTAAEHQPAGIQPDERRVLAMLRRAEMHAARRSAD